MNLDELAPLVQEAAGRIAPHVIRTPVLRVADSGRELGADVALKAEALQRTGSFKIRGAMNKILDFSAEDRERGVVTFSAGNHAAAVACACAEAGIDCYVVMWRTANPRKVAATQAWGATVDLEAGDSTEAADRLAAITQSSGRVLVHPFDDPLVIAGQGTATAELLEDAPEIDVLLVPTSGGGLLAGAVLACVAATQGDRPGMARGSAIDIVPVQPEAAPSLARARAHGGSVRYRPERTAADALAAPFFGSLNFDIVRDHVSDVVTVTEPEIADGVRWCYQRAKLAVEPGAAVPIAALLARRVSVQPGQRVGVLVSGANPDPAVIAPMLT
jgi:threo-3-hydroxy-L-aspartate ammonia-lyase